MRLQACYCKLVTALHTTVWSRPLSLAPHTLYQQWWDTFIIHVCLCACRYGDKLSLEERGLFQALRVNDYEVNFHLSALEAAERRHTPAGRSTAVTNRRWAALQRLEQGGEYFAEACTLIASDAARTCYVPSLSFVL